MPYQPLQYFLDEVHSAWLQRDIRVGRITCLGPRSDNWTGNFSIGDVNDAILNQHSRKDMQLFFQGMVVWYMRGGNTLQEAMRKAEDYIAFVTCRNCSFWRRLKWLTVTGRWSSNTQWA